LQRGMPIDNMFVVNHKSGFSLIEVIMAAVIFSIAAVGLFSTFSVQRESSDRSERRLQAAYCGRQVLEELRAKIDQRNWDSGYLQEGVHPPLLSYTLAPPCDAYLVNYTVANVATGGRKVTLNITWNEP